MLYATCRAPPDGPAAYLLAAVRMLLAYLLTAWCSG